MHIHTSEVTEVILVQPQQLGRIDNEDLKERGDLMNDLFSNKTASRKAPASLGLLISEPK